MLFTICWQTGSGFIKVVNQTNGNIYDLQLNGGYENGRAKEFKTNPATNDWIPSKDDYQVFDTSSSLTLHVLNYTK